MWEGEGRGGGVASSAAYLDIITISYGLAVRLFKVYKVDSSLSYMVSCTLCTYSKHFILFNHHT